MAFFNQINNGASRYLGGNHLLFQVIPKGVPPQSNNDSLFHVYLLGIRDWGSVPL
jgi:hypothetical protein